MKLKIILLTLISMILIVGCGGTPPEPPPPPPTEEVEAVPTEEIEAIETEEVEVVETEEAEVVETEEAEAVETEEAEAVEAVEAVETEEAEAVETEEAEESGIVEDSKVGEEAEMAEATDEAEAMEEAEESEAVETMEDGEINWISIPSGDEIPPHPDLQPIDEEDPIAFIVNTLLEQMEAEMGKELPEGGEFDIEAYALPTETEYADVLQFYTDELEALDGWEVSESADAGEMEGLEMTIWEKDENQGFFIMWVAGIDDQVEEITTPPYLIVVQVFGDEINTGP